VGQKFPS